MEARMTQAERLVSAIRRAGKKGASWGELEALRISTCPWVRLKESGHRFLRSGERLASRIGRDGLVRNVIVRA
jgi:hypothetical protein